MEIGDEPAARPTLPAPTLTGGVDSWPACQRWAGALRARGAGGFTALSAALRPGGAHGWQVDGGLRSGPARNGRALVLFGPRPDLVGWAATVSGRPGKELLDAVRHFCAVRHF